MGNVTYCHAIRADGVRIDIESVNQENRFQEFYCIDCGNELIPKLGSVNAHHFAHKSDVHCSGETYLHKLGKLVFRETYLKCLQEGLPFYLERYRLIHCNRYEFYRSSDCDKHGVDTIDLTQYFKNIVVESRDGSLVPDLMLLDDKGNKVYIEIAVTHQSSEQKIEFGNRIIEYVIKTEADLSLIKDCYVSYPFDFNFYSPEWIHQKDKIKRYNFKDIIEGESPGSCNCSIQLPVFFISRKYSTPYIKELSLQRIESLIKYNTALYYKILDLSPSCRDPYDLFAKQVVKAFDLGIDFKNCFLCRYHSRESNRMVFCNVSQETGGSVFLSKDCVKFEPDEIMYQRYR
ncbi:hypothetical protein C3K47_11945 [Solitalea longa]|uniref:Competence protein CoiA-like N-terminal domain-containing protein n=1 Tax=Solitalea longa TaxID=2079460 RepID=A0A2S5A1H5_9SPHI|nr:competence protein CoiA family protein [Solitalea longa]POY36448.1 hypothetical protein C3K47_11945 [Solitalea longa]